MSENDWITLDTVPSVPTDAPPDPDRFRTAAAVCQLPDPPGEQLLLGHLVVRGNRTLVLADSGHGKTTICLQMLYSIVMGEQFLHHTGLGNVSALIIDCEQGLRSVKRGLRESGLDLREDVYHWHQPDGLALDHDMDQVATLDNFLKHTRPDVVLLDPFYKAHQSEDPNSERAIVDLMRILDALRTTHHFALLLPVHPRKSDGRNGTIRKLALEDVAGSGAIYRGAEVVLAVERLHHGHARLRYLKDRDGDMPIGDTVPLTFTRGVGFEEDTAPATAAAARTELEEEILAASDDGWCGTVNEWKARTGKADSTVRTTLTRLYEQGRIGRATHIPGRKHNSVVWGGGAAIPTGTQHTIQEGDGQVDLDGDIPF